MLIALILSFLSAVFLARFVRTFGWVKIRRMAGQKPWSCDLCMAFWGSVASLAALAALGHVSWPDALLLLPASAGAAATALTMAGDFQPPPIP